MAINKTINAYFDGRRDADIDLLKSAFDQNTQMQTIDEKGTVERLSFADYLAMVEAAGPVKVKTEITDIHITGNAAAAQTRFDFGAVVYYDYLSLLKTKTGWKIVNKTFLKL